ncbi:MAG: DUF805 domain-containing protein [Pseudomonadota bacterium]
MNEVNPYESPTANASLGGDEAYEPKMLAFSGRIGRARYLAYSIVCNMLIGIPVGIVVAMFAGSGLLEGDSSVAAVIAIGLLYALSFVVLFVFARRRLNDLDRSGWWSLLFIVPLLNLILGLYLLFGPGTDGANRFGPPPTKNSSTILIVILALLVFVGILAAVAIPAYQDYVQRAAELQGQMSP